MFKRYPYWGWLVISSALWCINFFHFYAHRQEMLPEKMAYSVSADLKQKEDGFNALMKNEDLLRRMFADSVTAEEEKKINEMPFYIYGYQGDSLVFWNNNSVIGSRNDTTEGRITIRRNQKGVFIRKFIRLNSRGMNGSMVVLFPVMISYPLENDYLHSHFEASEHIPVTTKINELATHVPDEYRIMMNGGVEACYLVFNKADIQKWEPDMLLICMLIAAVISSIAWLQLMAIRLTRRVSPFWALGIMSAIIVASRLSLYAYGLPFHLDTLPIFSPRLYASASYLPSLGDLFLHILCVLWAVIFITRHTPYKTFFARAGHPVSRFFITLTVLAGLAGYAALFIKIVRSLVLDSSISFDVTHFYAINRYTTFGLLAIITIIAISCMVIYLFNVQLQVLVGRKWVKYACVIAGYVLLFSLAHKISDPFSWYLLGGLVIFIVLLDIPNFPLVSRLFEPHMIIWALVICAFSTGIIRYFNDQKEQATRVAFVEQHLSPHHDDYIEASFDKVARSIEQDKTLKNFFYKPTAAGRRLINQHLDQQYLNSVISKYQATVYLFDDDEKGLFNKDTANFDFLMNEKSESAITNSSYLFYKESILDRHYYLSYIPVYSDTVNNVIGYVIIDLDLKKALTETVYPELLQPPANKSSAGEHEYAYSVYVSGKLITQTNDYPFPIRLKHDTLKDQQSVFENTGGFSQLYYKIADKRTAVVVHHHSEIIETVTLFSYLFGIQILIAVLIFLYQLYLSYFSGKLFHKKFVRLTLRRRVHFSMLAVVFISFIIIGFVTISFFKSEYRLSNNNKLQTAMQVAKQSVQDYLERKNAFSTEFVFDSVTRSPTFKYFLTDLANSQKIDINIFDNEGNLYATSQDEIYDKGLISRKIQAQAYYELDNEGKSVVIQNEKVAGLSYNSAYQPLRDERGVTLGYINVPFFSSEKDLDFQISNILVTLINLYAFIFLVSSLLTVVVTRWMTRTFDIIIKKFETLNLEQNERIEWDYEDEIGNLVKGYNKMVKKVEENAARLAQSERESAWREMARQVAHEIKNPLTPMKLNIQYLQQAMRNDNPNIKQLAEKVSDSIIEQIDNLSYIASEFSNFATMPEAKPEELEPGTLLEKALELYYNDEGLTVTLQKSDEKLLVLADKSQLLRVFTNLLENARQAIAPGTDGTISVTLSRQGDSLMIAVADNGSGINEEVSKKIFQPYFTTKSSGTGLGLAMTRKIIEFWKGEIWFETKEHEGTTFFIKLPLAGNGS